MKQLVFFVLAAMTWSACAPTHATPAGGLDGGSTAAFRGLLATPPQVAFTCVTPGCDSTYSVTITSNVNRRIAIKRIVLSDPTDDYTITPSQAAPFILGAASDFSVEVRLVPKSAPKAENMRLLVTYTDAAAEESPDRLEPGELAVSLVRRLVGEPFMQASPESLSFGVVAVASTKRLPVVVKNAGFGNIAMSVDGFDAGSIPLSVALPPNLSLVPDAGVEVPIAFAPEKEMYLSGVIELVSSTPGVQPSLVKVEGTSYNWPRAVVEPEETAIDFGPVPVGDSAMVTVRLANLGGQDLNLTKVSVDDPSGNVSVKLVNGTTDTTATLASLQRIGLQLSLKAKTAGVLAANLLVDTSDPLRPRISVPITGTITSPKVQLSPTVADWGTVPMGWVVAKSFEVRNVGYGKLQVKHVTFVGGSSNLFTLKNVPALPTSLDRNQRIAFDVEFRAETAAPFTGSVSVETDDPMNPFTEIPLTAAGGKCADACPIAHGTSSCANGTCDVGSCNAGWYDTNQSASDGCECQEIGTDPGVFCSEMADKGTMSDSGSSGSFTGILSSGDDIDFIRFFGEDKSQVFGDDYDVRVTLQTSDPNIQMCVYRYETASGVGECYLNNEDCGRNYRHDGSYGREDGAMFYIKVFRTPNTPGACVPYTVYMSNG